MSVALARRTGLMPESAPFPGQESNFRSGTQPLSRPVSRPHIAVPAAPRPVALAITPNIDTAPAQNPARNLEGIATLVIMLLSVAAVGYGYATKNSDAFVPYEGAGYYLGIVGGTGMLLQLFYSAVKRLKPFRRIAASRVMFNMHMILGLAAPITILYHCNFSWGAKNSNVALGAMLMVVVSGLIGRIVYKHVNVGLSGARADVYGMLEQARSLLQVIERDTGGSGGQIAMRLSQFAADSDFNRQAFLRQLAASVTIPFKTRLAKLKFGSMIRRAVAENAVEQGWSQADQKWHRKVANKHVGEFLETYGRASQLAFWERLFSLWHLLHVPLFYLLVLSGIAHVVAVHWY